MKDTRYNFRFDQVSAVNELVDREVADVYTTSDPALLLENDRPEAPGRFVVIILKDSLNGGWTTLAAGMGGKINPDQPTEVRQLEDVLGARGNVLAAADPDNALTLTEASINRQVDQFAHGVFNAAVGQPLNYDYRLPANYDSAKKYPLVVALPGYGQGYDGGNLRVHLTTDMLAPAWASHEWIGRDEDVIVLAPQNRRTGVATEGPQTAELVEYFSSQFAVDKRRVYATSVSYGSTLMWWLFANRPDLFAAGLMTGGMANNAAQAAAIVAAEVPLWITHGVGDHLLPVANSRASYQRIADGYAAKGYSPERVAELVKWTEYGDSAFTLLDRHLAAAPTLEDESIMQWVLDQAKPPAVATTSDGRCVVGKAMPTVTVRNDDSVPMDISITTAYGAKVFKGVTPGKSAFQAFTTRQPSIAAAVATVDISAVIDGKTVTHQLKVPTPAWACS